ncbi:hypothetical protein OEZ86_009270 [Tetradesmus obliquus]|nr:hypothetical protein OEZ86_009270 [Tetradesmus obliquus]
MAPAVTVDVTLTQSSSYRASKAETFRLTTPAQIDRHVNRAAAAAPAGAEEQQEAAVLQAASSSSSLQDAGFDQLCNDGAAWTWSNFVVKLYRNTLGLLKQLYLIFMTLSLRTNHLMLTFRTMTRDFDEPNCNGDFLAAKFRNAIMPARGRLHDQRSRLIKINRDAIEFPFLGIPGIVRFIDVRTQWFDEGVTAAMDDGITQVVIIAAGYDTRAYRLSRPGVKFYEIDLPHASKNKQELVRSLLPADKYPRPEFVAADLSKVKLADALAATSFDPTKTTLFTAEGLVYYLPPAAVQQLLTCVSSSSAPGSRLMFDFLNLSTVRGDVWHPGFETLQISVYNKGERMYNGIDERPQAVRRLLSLFGFGGCCVSGAQSMVKRYMPHEQYCSRPPTVSPYFSYVSAVKE